jgi:type III restriction enzyme
MSLPLQISRYMSLREPQYEALDLLHAVSEDTDYKTAQPAMVAEIATQKAHKQEPLSFDTDFPSFCFALATGVGKTRLMGANIYYLWKTKGYRHFFILSPNITIYNKLRAELRSSHAKYMFTGLSDFPAPVVFDGDNYVRFSPQQVELGDPAIIFVFNIGKIFTRADTDFKFHSFSEYLGDSFAAILKQMDDLVILMDESHRYRAPASLKAINNLKPVLGLEYTATPKESQKNILYSFTLAQSMGKFIKTPTVVTRTNLTTADAEEIDKLKILDGLALHEKKKARMEEYCAANRLPLVKPFVLISTRDTTHASAIKAMIEADTFHDGRYKGKVIEIHSGTSSTESDINIERLLSVEQPSSTVEVVVHVNMLKEGWDVKNLCTIIPLRASISEILTEQTIGRGLRLPFGTLTGDPDLDALEIVSHDNYARLIESARHNPLFQIKEITDADLLPVKTIPVAPRYTDIEKALDKLSEAKFSLFANQFTNKDLLDQAVKHLVDADIASYQTAQAAAAVATVAGQPGETVVQTGLDLGTAPTPMPPAPPPDPDQLAEHYKEQLTTFADRYIDVPRIYVDVSPERKLEPFEVQVRKGPFELVDQHMIGHNLATGQDRLGDKVDVMEIENPRAFIAGRLIDAVDELDAMHDKDLALHLADQYITKLNRSDEDIRKLVHLYRGAIVEDIEAQITEHLQQSTHFEVQVAKNPVRFQNYSKTVLATDGIKQYTDSVQASQIRKYLFEGFQKTIYPYVPFDSVPEKEFAAVLESDPAVKKWIRPPEASIPISHRGQSYTPDFVVETERGKLIIEIKGMRDLIPTINDQVKEKARAAIKWAEVASKIDGEKPWDYKLVPEDAVGAGREMAFVLGHAVRV